MSFVFFSLIADIIKSFECCVVLSRLVGAEGEVVLQGREIVVLSLDIFGQNGGLDEINRSRSRLE